VVTAKIILKEISQKLKDSNASNSPQLDAEILVSHITGQSRENLFLNLDFEIDEKAIAPLVERRIEGEPIAYIIGKKEFWGMDFVVNENVLIPRPDTELLIEIAKKKFAQNAELKILDLGTGSGCIIISLLKEFPNATGFAVDNSAKALEVASQNAKLNDVRNIEFIKSDWFECMPRTKFDLIVSNPPYIDTSDERVDFSTREFEPSSALFAKNNGLECYKTIASSIGRYLKKDGLALFEFGQDQHEDVAEIFKKCGFENITLHNDLSGIIRVISVRS